MAITSRIAGTPTSRTKSINASTAMTIKNASTGLRRRTAATTDHYAKVRRLLIVGQSLAY